MYDRVGRRDSTSVDCSNGVCALEYTAKAIKSLSFNRECEGSRLSCLSVIKSSFPGVNPLDKSKSLG